METRNSTPKPNTAVLNNFNPKYQKNSKSNRNRAKESNLDKINFEVS